MTTPTKANERQVTVQRKSFYRRTGWVEAPQIIVAGVYLQRLGFTIGKKVTITEEEGRLTITVDKDQPVSKRNLKAEQTLTRKMDELKRHFEQETAPEYPCKKEILTDYLRGAMPADMQEVVSLFLDGSIPPHLKGPVNKLLAGELDWYRAESVKDSAIQHIHDRKNRLVAAIQPTDSKQDNIPDPARIDQKPPKLTRKRTPRPKLPSARIPESTIKQEPRSPYIELTPDVRASVEGILHDPNRRASTIALVKDLLARDTARLKLLLEKADQLPEVPTPVPDALPATGIAQPQIDQSNACAPSPEIQNTPGSPELPDTPDLQTAMPMPPDAFPLHTIDPEPEATADPEPADLPVIQLTLDRSLSTA